MRRSISIAAIPLSLALAACAPSGIQPSSTAATAATADVDEAGSDAPSPSLDLGAVPAALLAAVLADAADRAGVDPEEVEVTTAEAVTWSDGSLGCPEPGQMYTQALVPGYRVVVRAGGERLNYHAAQSGDPRYCEHPRPPAEGSGSQ